MINNYTALSKRYLKHNKKKSILTIIGIILSVALICSIGSFLVTIQNTMLQDAIEKNGEYHLTILNPTKDNIDKIENNPKVEYVSNLKTEPPVPFIKDKKIIINKGDKNITKANSVKVKSGKLPAKEGEIAIEEWVLKYFDTKPKIGNNVEIKNINGKIEKYTLTAIVENKSVSQYSGNAMAYTYTELKDIKDTVLLVKIKGKTGKRKVIEDIKNLVGEKNVIENDQVLRLTGEASNSNINKSLFGIGGIIIGIVIIATVMVIYNSFNISIAERSKNFGQLKAMGATKKQIRKLVLIEALIMMSIGIPIGLGLGLLAMYIVSIVFKFLATGFELNVIVSPMVLLVSSVLGAISVYVSALIPARKVSKISPLVAISTSYLISKDNVTNKKSRVKFVKSFGISKIMAIKNIKRNKKRFYITAISMAISVILFVVFMSFIKYTMNFTEKPSPQNDVTFAIQENKETLKHKGLSDEFLKEVNKVSNIDEIYLNYRPLKLKALVDENEIPEIIKEQKYNFIKDVKLDGEHRKYISVYMNAYDDNKIKSLDKYIKEGSTENIKENEVILVKNQTMPGGIYSPIVDLKVGDEIKVDPKYFYDKEELTIKDYKEGKKPEIKENPKSQYTGNELITLKVKAIVEDEPYKGMGDPGIEKIIIPSNNLKKIIKNNDVYMKKFGVSSAYLKVNNDEKIENVENTLVKSLGNYPSYEVKNMVELSRKSKGEAIQMMILLIGFIVVISLISSINVINTVTTNIITRRRELSGLRAIGMTTKELKNMISLEGALFGVYGGASGSIIGVCLSYLIYLRFSDIKNFTFKLPWASVGIAMAAVIIIGYLSSIIAMRKLSQDNIIEGIKQE
ncbi:ABC transporter permease [Haloimpatiens sp. FM7330]|uniref:ABC transporter permease n=1 Tax=Haloimpatiens sp. FM7330 TaxID=3298610 RepID=UPI00362EED12